MPIKIFFESVNTWHSYRQKGVLCHALTSTFSKVVARCVFSDINVLPCSFLAWQHVLGVVGFLITV